MVVYSSVVVDSSLVVCSSVVVCSSLVVCISVVVQQHHFNHRTEETLAQEKIAFPPEIDFMEQKGHSGCKTFGEEQSYIIEILIMLF